MCQHKELPLVQTRKDGQCKVSEWWLDLLQSYASDVVIGGRCRTAESAILSWDFNLWRLPLSISSQISRFLNSVAVHPMFEGTRDD